MKFERGSTIIATLGPSSFSPEILRRLSRQAISFVRINLSHTPPEQLAETVALVREHCSIPLMLDTEGSQVRTGLLSAPLVLRHNQTVMVGRDSHCKPGELPLRPAQVFNQLMEGDLLAVDFDSAVLRVDDVSRATEGRLVCTALSGGTVQSNKAVTVGGRSLSLPALSDKDVFAVDFALQNGLRNFCLSFTDCAEDVTELRALHSDAFVIAKIETRLGVQNLDAIMAEANGILIDRGDLSREVPVERLPFAQKHIIARANEAGLPVVVATNLLDSMIDGRSPSRAETNDIVNTLLDGADGLVLAAETAIGKHPVETVAFLTGIMTEVRDTQKGMLSVTGQIEGLGKTRQANYIVGPSVGYGLVSPNGGALVGQHWEGPIPSDLPRVPVTEEQAMDAEQIAIGTYSPLTGFMTEEELNSVATRLRLPDGVIWPMPVLLRTPQKIDAGRQVVLVRGDQPFAVLDVTECFERDWAAVAREVYGTDDTRHLGVRAFIEAGPFAIAGRVWLSERLNRPAKRYELTPAQCRRLFEARRWSVVVGFHTRNAPHRAHEHIIREAMRRTDADGLLLHPAVGPKKSGDFTVHGIVAGFEELLADSDLAERAVLGTFATYSRYGGPREALFTALCRQNFGCSHFVVGRDHTGVFDFYAPDASQRIFEEFPDLAVQAVPFGEVRYLSESGRYGSADVQSEGETMTLSGTEARKILARGESPPEWYMRPAVARRLLGVGADLFVP